MVFPVFVLPGDWGCLGEFDGRFGQHCDTHKYLWNLTFWMFTKPHIGLAKSDMRLMPRQHSYANRILTEMKYSSPYNSRLLQNSTRNSPKWVGASILAPRPSPPLP